jgi:hypothetical protein
MPVHHYTPRACWVLVAVAAVSLGGCDIAVGSADYRVSEAKEFSVTGVPRVDLTTFDGSIEVTGWDRQEVRVEVEKRAFDQQSADSIKVESKQEGGHITMNVLQPMGLGSHGWSKSSPSAKLTVSVPRQSDLVIRSGDGSLAVRRVKGTFDLRTDDGSIRLDEAVGTILGRTTDGSVSGRDIEGAVDVETGDGSIHLTGVLRKVHLETHDGSVGLKARDGSAMDDDWSITTGDGSLRAELPKDFSAEVDAQSGEGQVNVDGIARPDNGERDHTRQERPIVRGTLGKGGRTLRLRSGDGSISVRVW